jgi:choline dehydrogenase-like flavoprotein
VVARPPLSLSSGAPVDRISRLFYRLNESDRWMDRMLIDAESLEEPGAIEAGVVIVGGGMAGLALARQLADAGHEVAVLESGGERPDPRTQAMYEGRATLRAARNDTRDVSDFMSASRQRCLGGSGNIWGGKCAPLDDMDFAARSWIPNSGWPVTRQQLMPYYDRACALLQLPAFGTSGGPEGLRREGLLTGRSRLFEPRPRCYTTYSGAARGPEYGAFKRAAIDHPRIRIYLHANVTRIRLEQGGRQVVSLLVQSLNGRRREARGQTYVLATGGIENARLLLASNDVQKAGIGNHSDWLGRGFLVHTTIARFADTAIALTKSPEDMAAYDIGVRDRPHVVIGASSHAQSLNRTGNFTATLSSGPSREDEPSDAVRALAKRLSGTDRVAQQPVYFMVEQTPERASRLSLSAEERDELGLPRVALDLYYSELSLDTLEKMVRHLGSELGRLDSGRLRWGAQREEVVGAMNLSRHHMGATRMAEAPSNGVVNADCRVHGVENLYVAGSSVFPTSGIANPTLTLLALGFRLGDHLISRARRA